MAHQPDTEVTFNLNDDPLQASASNSTVKWPGSHVPDGETGGSCDTWPLSRLHMEAQFDASSSRLSPFASAGLPAESFTSGRGQTSKEQVEWQALFQRQCAKIDGLMDSVDLLRGQVNSRESKAPIHGSGGVSFGPLAQYRRSTQQLHQQDEQQWGLQQQLPQQIPHLLRQTQQGQVFGSTD